MAAMSALSGRSIRVASEVVPQHAAVAHSLASAHRHRDACARAWIPHEVLSEHSETWSVDLFG
jgi:hypothetical protein